MKHCNYLKTIVIVHGKSEYQMCSFIKSELRLQMEILARNNGKSSIQITSLMKFLKHNKCTSSLKNFKNELGDSLPIDNKGKIIIPDDLKIFTIMDTDDCTQKQKNSYIAKEMFEDFWCKDYIFPIYNILNLEDVLKKSKIKYKKKHPEDQKKEYVEIFPTETKYKQNSTKIDLIEFQDNLSKCPNTNMEHFIAHCLEEAKNNPYFKN
ncbi:MAG: hypothetical protein IJ877_03715 [Candidatus Gastranaerophilales bacterium]|nr:hypothetical protein [Candidatus Gastranaerophilales bacterium]